MYSSIGMHKGYSLLGYTRTRYLNDIVKFANQNVAKLQRILFCNLNYLYQVGEN